MSLTRADFIDDASRIGCEVEVIQAVFQVESAGKGFRADGFPRTLYEGHLFYRFTKGKFAVSHPDLCFPSWDKTKYGKTEALETWRFESACRLDRTSALLSTSFGLPQIVGMNYAKAGCKTIQQFINRMCKSENEQLSLFTDFVINSGLADELQAHDWTRFARIYNGTGQVAYYSDKMAKAYAKLTQG